MTEKIRLEIEDATTPGLESVEQGFKELKQDADKLEKSLNEAAAAQDKLTSKGKDVKSKLSMPLTELNQGIQLLKQGAQVAAQALESMAADGNAGALELKGALEDLRGSLLDLANDPEVQNFFTSMADGIKTNLIPALEQVPETVRSWQAGYSRALTQFWETIGIAAEGTTEALKEMQAQQEVSLDLAREAIDLAKQKAAVDDKLLAVEKRIAEQEQLTALAQQTSLTNVRILLEEETEALKELAKDGRATREEQEKALKRIEILQRRLVDIPKEEQNATIKSQEAAGQERFETAQKAKDDAEKLAEKVAAEAQKEVDAVIAAEERKRQERQRSVDELSKKLQPDIDKARQAIDPRALREEIASQRENRAHAMGGSKADIRAARAQAFNDFNRGNVSQGEVQSAQTALLQGAVNQAQASGRLGNEAATTMREIVNTQQEAAAQNQQLTNEIIAIRQQLAVVGQGQRQNGQRLRSQRGGIGSP